MIFNSYNYLIFLPIVLLVYYAIPSKIQWIWLLITSYYFYMCWNPKYVVLLIYATGVTYLGAILIKKFTKYKKWLLALTILACLSSLLCFKYLTFIWDSVEKLLSLTQSTIRIPKKDFLLPMGISFYSFQAIGYVVDVYRNKQEPEKNPFRYALFISFFPQLVAGPIERSGNLLAQLKERHRFSFEQMREGLLLILWGFFLKLVLADRMAVLVDTVYGNYSDYTGLYLMIATVFFGIQIYCDFYGYSVIAMGSAKMLGINLMENFESPYLAMSVAEFWRRWHVSLTSWFKDYLYIPLGGNKKGKAREYINKIIVFLVSGLWHGANWTYVVWGGLNGVYQVIGELLKPLRDKMDKVCDKSLIGTKIAKVLITFILVDFSWIFFRADSMQAAVSIIRGMFLECNLWILTDGSLYQLGLKPHDFDILWISLLILLFADVCKKRKCILRNQIIQQNLAVRWIVYIVALFYVVIYGRYGADYGSSFIYFQF